MIGLRVHPRTATPTPLARMVLTAIVLVMHQGRSQTDLGTCGTHWPAVGPRGTEPAEVFRETAPMSRPALHTSIVSPLGHFRVHFDTTGINEPALVDQNVVRIPGTARAFADSIAYAFDCSWTVIIDEKGYDPPLDDADGGDGLYDVYIMSLSPSLFGETQFADAPFQTEPNNRYETWIIIDNDFTTQRTKGLAGAFVTAAHEFFHAVQVGRYGYWGQADAYWYELSSTWMEDEVFPGVNDYLFEVSRFMTSFRTTRFNEFSSTFRGYERVLFAQYLSERYGPSTLRSVWERIRSERALPALAGTLSSLGTSLEMAFRGFAKWNFYTSDRSDPAVSYSRGSLFPRLDPVLYASLMGSETSMSFDFPPLSIGLFAVCVDADTVFIMVTNTDVPAALRGGFVVEAPTVVLSRSAQDRPSQSLAMGVTGGLEATDPSVFDIEYFSSSMATVAARKNAEAFPNPWELSSPFALAIPTDGLPGTIVDVYLISSDLRTISLGAHSITEEKGRSAVLISAADVRGRAASGAYVAIVRRSDGDDLSKIVIIQ